MASRSIHSREVNQIIERQMRQWELERDAQDKKEREAHLAGGKGEVIDYIAISREPGSGGEKIAQILADLGVHTMRLMTNNPKKMSGLESYGLNIAEQLPITTKPNPHNRRYLGTKQKKMGHILKVLDNIKE